MLADIDMPCAVLEAVPARTIGYPLSAEALVPGIARELGRAVPVLPPALPEGLPDDPSG